MELLEAVEDVNRPYTIGYFSCYQRIDGLSIGFSLYRKFFRCGVADEMITRSGCPMKVVILLLGILASLICASECVTFRINGCIVTGVPTHKETCDLKSDILEANFWRRVCVTPAHMPWKVKGPYMSGILFGFVFIVYGFAIYFYSSRVGQRAFMDRHKTTKILLAGLACGWLFWLLCSVSILGMIFEVVESTSGSRAYHLVSLRVNLCHVDYNNLSTMHAAFVLAKGLPCVIVIALVRYASHANYDFSSVMANQPIPPNFGQHDSETAMDLGSGWYSRYMKIILFPPRIRVSSHLHRKIIQTNMANPKLQTLRDGDVCHYVLPAPHRNIPAHGLLDEDQYDDRPARRLEEVFGEGEVAINRIVDMLGHPGPGLLPEEQNDAGDGTSSASSAQGQVCGEGRVRYSTKSRADGRPTTGEPQPSTSRETRRVPEPRGWTGGYQPAQLFTAVDLSDHE